MMSQYTSLLFQALPPFWPNSLLALLLEYYTPFQGKQNGKIAQLETEEQLFLVENFQLLSLDTRQQLQLWSITSRCLLHSFSSPLLASFTARLCTTYKEWGYCAVSSKGCTQLLCYNLNEGREIASWCLPYQIKDCLALGEGELLLLEAEYPLSKLHLLIQGNGTLLAETTGQVCLISSDEFVVAQKKELVFYTREGTSFRPSRSYTWSNKRNKLASLFKTAETRLTQLQLFANNTLVYVTEAPNAIYCYDYQKQQLVASYQLGLVKVKQLQFITEEKIAIVGTILEYRDIVIMWTPYSPKQSYRLQIPTSETSSSIELLAVLSDTRLLANYNQQLLLISKTKYCFLNTEESGYKQALVLADESVLLLTTGGEVEVWS